MKTAEHLAADYAVAAYAAAHSVPESEVEPGDLGLAEVRQVLAAAVAAARLEARAEIDALREELNSAAVAYSVLDDEVHQARKPLGTAYLDAVQERVAAARPGPWSASEWGHSGADEPSTIVIHQGAFNWQGIRDGEYVAKTSVWDRQEFDDAVFISHAREDIPALLALLRELQDRLADER